MSSKPKALLRGDANKQPYIALVHAAVLRIQSTNPYLSPQEAVSQAAAEVANVINDRKVTKELLENMYHQNNQSSSSSQAGHPPQFAFPMAQVQMQQHSQVYHNSSASLVMPGSVQGPFSQNMSSHFQQGYSGPFPPSASIPSPSFVPTPPVPAGAALTRQSPDHSLGSFGTSFPLLGDMSPIAAGVGDMSISSPNWKGLEICEKKETEMGSFDTNNWPLMKRFIKLVNSHFFENAIANARLDGRKASTIGGGVREAELFSHPDTLMDMYLSANDSLKHVPISIADIVELKWNEDFTEPKWSHSDSQMLFLEFAKKWKERHPQWEIISMLLLYSNGRMESDQDVHIDIGRGGGQFIFSAADHEVACTVTYDDKDQYAGRGSLCPSLAFLKDWRVKDKDIQTLKDAMSDFFDDVHNGEEEDHLGLIDSDHGALLHDFGKRENHESLHEGDYCFQEGPVPHRAPHLEAPNGKSKPSREKRLQFKSTGIARPVIFGVVRHRNTDYTYDYDDQKTPPQLVGEIIETLFPRLQLLSDFKHVNEYEASAHYSAKSSLLVVYAKTIFRSNDFPTERDRMFQSTGYPLAKKIFNVLVDSKRNLKHENDVFRFNLIKPDLLQEMMQICDDWSSEKKKKSNQKRSSMETD